MKGNNKGGGTFSISSSRAYITSILFTSIFSTETRSMGLSSVYFSCSSSSFFGKISSIKAKSSIRSSLPASFLLSFGLQWTSPLLGQHLLKFSFQLGNFVRGGPALLCLSLQLPNLVLKCGHFVLGGFYPIFKGRLWSTSLVQVCLEFFDRL